MDDTNWESYGTGNYEKCADCMVHCGYEPTAVTDTINHPLKALKVFLKGIETVAPMAREIPLENQRSAEYHKAFLSSMRTTDKILNTSIPGMVGYEKLEREQKLEKNLSQFKEFLWLLK